VEIGITSVTFRKLDYKTVLKYCVESGLSCIEWGSDIHAPETDFATVRAVKEESDKAGIRICSYGSYYELCVHENYRETFRPYLEAAVILDAPIIRLWAGTMGADKATKEYYGQAVQETQTLCDMAAEYGITLAFEYHRNSLSDTADSAVQIYKDINRKNFALYYQYDSQISIEENIISLEKMLPYIKMVHVAYFDSKYKKLSLEEGDGITLWTRLVELLKEHQVEVCLLFEFLKDDSLEGLKYEMKIMERIVC